jgi:iron(III) transport system ATP-binding protein
MATELAAHTKKGTLEFRGVTKSYGTGDPAVNNISFSLKDGELVTLLGPSGCGKTTTLRMIAGLEMPTQGIILLGGKDVTALSAAQRNVSLVFQSYALFPHMTVMQNASYGPRMQGSSVKDAEAKAAEALKTVGLTGYESRLPSELSGGQQQRVAIARALVLEPAVLLFDEPLSNLDARLRRRVRQEIRDLQQRLAITCVYVTHDREEALAVSDNIIVMDRGVIAESGPPSKLFFNPDSAFVADFLSEANLVDAKVDGTKISAGGHSFVVPAAQIASGATKLVLRPDVFTVGTVADQPSITGKVLKSAFVGRGAECEVDTPLGELFIFLPRHTALPEIGSQLTLSFDPAAVTVVR